MYLVDTNVVSEARRGAPEAVRWLRSVDPLAVHLSVITLGEIMRRFVAGGGSVPTYPPKSCEMTCLTMSGPLSQKITSTATNEPPAMMPDATGIMWLSAAVFFAR